MAMTTKLTIASFSTEASLLHAMREARKNDISIVDSYTPYAVHGLEEAMGSRGTRLGTFCFALGLTGLLTGLLFQLWTTSMSWPLNVGGKTHSAVPALIPITFEVTILFAAVGSVFGFFLRSRLWPGQEPAVLYEGSTDDRFVLVVRGAEDAEIPPIDFMKKLGASDVRQEGGSQ